MAKLPRAGAVKTRLGSRLTDRQCAELYTAFLDDKVESVCGVPNASPVLAFTPDDAEGWFAERYGSRVRLLAQRGADLGERLANAAGALFSEGFSSVLLVDSDTPNLPCDYFSRAMAALAGGSDVVLGPTSDGGYYLIGMSCFRPELFRGIHWSTPSVTAETLALAHDFGLSVHVLPVWYDVDTPADLDRLVADARFGGLGPGHARHTLGVLDRMVMAPVEGRPLER